MARFSCVYVLQESITTQTFLKTLMSTVDFCFLNNIIQIINGLLLNIEIFCYAKIINFIELKKWK